MGSSASKKKPDPPKQTNLSLKDNNNNKSPLKISHQGGPPYKPFAEFPDYQSLVQGQKDYGKSTYEIENDRDDVPLPFPLTVPRHDVWDRQRMAEIDLHAKMARPELARDLAQLTEYLTSIGSTGVEKVWAIFAWLSSRDRENTLPALRTEPPAEGTPLHYLGRIMLQAQTGAYNELFSKLCSAAKIPCKTVTGKIKASAKELGESPTSVSSYSMVFVDKNWRFVQPNWGCCYVKRVRTPEDWKLVEGVAGTKAGLGKATPDLLGFYREEFWFLTDPEVMAHVFLAADPGLQLLARPVIMDEFALMARLYKPFFEMGLTSIAPAKCKLDVEKSFTVEIGVTKTCSTSFEYAIFKRANDPDLKHAHKSIKEYMFVDRKANVLRAKFEIPYIGVYKIEINGRSELYSGSVTLCEYLIDCKTPNFACKPNPVNPLQEWGLRPGAKTLGLELENDEGGLLFAERGRVRVNFKRNLTQKAQFKYELQSQTKTNFDLTKYVRYYESETRQTVIARTPKHGNYSLKISAKREDELKYQVISNYLIKSDRGIADPTPFPDANGGKIGSTHKYGEPLLVPITHKEAVIDGTPGGRLVIRMKETLDLDINPVLTTANKKAMSEYVYSYREGRERAFVLRFPEVGWYSLAIKGTWENSAHGPENLYQYVIVADEVHPNCTPFPVRTRAWEENNAIIEPMDGWLLPDTEHSFRYRIDAAASVFLVNDGQKVAMARDDDTSGLGGQEWHTTTKTGSSGQTIRLLIQRAGRDDTEELATHKVMSNQEADMLARQHKDSTKHKEELLKKDEGEERQLQARKDAEAKRVEALERDFEKNKTTYRSKQKQLEEAELKKNPDQGQTFKEFQMRAEEDEKKDMSRWKEIWEDISGKLPIEKLKEAIRSRNKNRLQVALTEARDNKVPKDNEIMFQAERELELLLVKEDLKGAMDERDANKIADQVQRIYNNSWYMSRLQPEAAEAYQLLERLRHIRDMRVTHLDMKSATLSEMRRYNSPPEPVHKVMQAALLMFEEDEEATEKWRDCQPHINPSGSKNLVRRVMDFRPEKVHPEVAARAREMLDVYEMEKIQDVSPAAATFYAWTMGVVDSVLSSTEDKVIPANIKRQKELFGHPVITPRKNYEFRFSMQKSKPHH